MKTIELQNVSIAEYMKLLRSGANKELTALIDAELSKSLGGLGNGFDLNLFMLQKDLLIFQCKYAVAMFAFENEKLPTLDQKIKELQDQLNKKLKKSESTKKPNPYKNFLSWILSVEKYLGFAIDKNNDLLYFTEATKQMLNHYEAQKKQYEDNKIKSGRK
jgi:hypothetical protein